MFDAIATPLAKGIVALEKKMSISGIQNTIQEAVVVRSGFKGCFKDTSTRDLPYILNGNRFLPRQCIQQCGAKGYRYAAVQYGGQRFCGQRYGRFGRVATKDCVRPCRANPLVACGAAWRSMVYEVPSSFFKKKKVAPVKVTKGNVLGCFKDNGPVRDLPLRVPGDRLLPQACVQECGKRKYRYAGIQYGGECWCGNSYGRYGRASLGDCRMPCRANVSLKMCGNASRNLVYAVPSR